MATLIERFDKTISSLPEDITLVAVSKTKPASDIQTLYDHGHRDFGENKVQELTSKYEELPKDIRWHFIGHLQRNKVKYLAPFVHLIHGVDSPRLLKEINKRAGNEERVIDVLLQIHIAKEESKFGFSYDEIEELISSGKLDEYKNVEVVGLMAMATNTEDKEKIAGEFKELEGFYHQKQQDIPTLKTLSIGMSGDYEIALDYGSTMVRIGSSIFGERDYH